jgi:hypothetical protein
MPKLLERPWRYRVIALVGMLLALLIVTLAPQHFSELTDWGYLYATENFSHGRLVINDSLHREQVTMVEEQGSELVNYVRVGDNWAFEKAPGYVFYLVPFYLLHLPKLGNTLLALGLVAITYLLLARLKDEKVAVIGLLLLIFTPACLSMWQRFFMDSFAALAFSGMGGGLYLYYNLERARLKPFAGGFILFMAALLLGWSVMVRYSNALIVLVFGLHFLISRAWGWERDQRRFILQEGLYFGLGTLIPLLLVMSYQQVVFGSPFLTGYHFSHSATFAWNPILNWTGGLIIHNNLRDLWVPLLVGYPLLLTALPAMGIILFQKIRPRLPGKRQPISGDPWPELDRGSLILIFGWILAVFGFYVMYQQTAIQMATRMPFMTLIRYYLPAALPLTLLAAPVLARLSRRLLFSIVMTAIFLGLCFYMQSSLTQNITGEPETALLLYLGLKFPKGGKVS